MLSRWLTHGSISSIQSRSHFNRASIAPQLELSLTLRSALMVRDASSSRPKEITP
jgi:hypothetical protein